ncbi:MAG: endolytic transglycosylase MltG [Alistipes sp.]|nr:endolytic transglycosylase MltG [Alistipes sp.]
MSKNFLKKIYITGSVLTLLLIGTAAIAYYAFYGSAIDTKTTIRIDHKSNYAEVRAEIDGIIESNIQSAAFNFYASHINLERRFKPGYYEIEPATNVIRLARRLALGDQTPIKLVINNCRTLPQLSQQIAKQIACDSMQIISAMHDTKLRAELGNVKDSLIATFIPNTYEIYWTITPEDLLRRMKRESDNFWNEERVAKLKRTRLTQYQVITLASIVYEETKCREEMPLIAGVYINRLRRRIALQACPTVKYALGDFTLTRILHKHTRTRSPFNTYINQGLPPAPICIPSIAAIDAVLNYTEHNYLYFCAKPEFDGRHNFARTLREHNANSRQYLRALKGVNNK